MDDVELEARDLEITIVGTVMKTIAKLSQASAAKKGSRRGIRGRGGIKVSTRQTTEENVYGSESLTETQNSCR